MNIPFKKFLSILLIMSFSAQSLYAAGGAESFNLSPQSQINKAVSSVDSNEIKPLPTKEIKALAEEYYTPIHEAYEKRYSKWQKDTAFLNQTETIEIIQDLKDYFYQEEQKSFEQFSKDLMSVSFRKFKGSIDFWSLDDTRA